MKKSKQRLAAPFIIRSVVVYGLAMTSLDVLGAALSEPFSSGNRHPFVQVYGLPTAKTAVITSPSSYAVALQLDASNNFSSSSEGNESIFIDGETHRANIYLSYGLTSNISIAIDVPYLSHEGGGLDNFIEGWHKAFGFPDGGRPDSAADQILFTYSNNGVAEVVIDEPESGLGDISVSLAYQLPSIEEKNIAIRAGIKLPTGDADSLLGSESTDIYAGLYVSDVTSAHWHWHAYGGILWIGEGDILDERRNDFVAYGSGSLSYLWSEDIHLKIQLDLHSAFYDSQTKELGDASAQLVLGGSVRLTQSTLLDISVSEDVVVDTAPDVVFQLGLRKSW